MAREVGFNFSVGARMARSVGSVFDTVAGRAGKLKSDLKDLRALSAASGRVTSAGARVAQLQAEANAGKNVDKELQAASRAYASAQRNAAKYGVSVKNAASIHAKATREIKRTENALKRQDVYLRNRAKRSELKGEIMGTLATVGLAAAPIKMAVDFESAMADAAKTIEGMRDETGKLTPEYYAIENAVKRMGRSLPLTHEELAGLFAAGGQMGYKTADQLEEFSTMAAHMSVAFNVAREDAASMIGGYRSALGLSFDDTRDMLDLMNQFANTSSATEKSIANIMGRVGALGDVAGLSYKPMTALAATLASMKVKDDIAATGIKNVMLSLTTAPVNKKKGDALRGIGIDPDKLARQMQEDGEAALISVFERISQLEAHQKPIVLERLFGKESLGAIAPMLSQLDLLRENLNKTADQSAYAGAMQREFENRAKTTANALTLTKNRAAEVAITLGGAMLPAINDTLGVLGQGASAVADFAVAHPGANTAIMGTVTALAGLKLASLAGRFAVTGLSDAWATMGRVWGIAGAMCRRTTYAMLWQRGAAIAVGAASRVMAVGQGLVTTAQWALNTAMSANPIGIVIRGVALLGALLYGLYETCEPVREVVDWLWEGMQEGIKPIFALLEAAWDKLEWVWKGIKKVASWFYDDDEEAPEAKAKPVEPVPAPVDPVPAQARSKPAAPPPMPRHGDYQGSAALSERLQGGTLPAGYAPGGGFGGGPVQVSQQITVNAQISELKREVLDALKSSGRELETILGNLMRDKARVSYG